jgi:hypothetical protein
LFLLIDIPPMRGSYRNGQFGSRTEPLHPSLADDSERRLADSGGCLIGSRETRELYLNALQTLREKRETDREGNCSPRMTCCS